MSARRLAAVLLVIGWLAFLALLIASSIENIKEYRDQPQRVVIHPG